MLEVIAFETTRVENEPAEVGEADRADHEEGEDILRRRVELVDRAWQNQRERESAEERAWMRISIVPAVSTMKPQKIRACIGPAIGSRKILVCAMPMVRTFLRRCSGRSVRPSARPRRMY